jgi:hypothetical protein
VASERLFSGLEVLDIAKGPVSMVSVPSAEQLARSPRSARLGIYYWGFLRFDGL